MDNKVKAHFNKMQRFVKLNIFVCHKKYFFQQYSVNWDFVQSCFFCLTILTTIGKINEH